MDHLVAVRWERRPGLAGRGGRPEWRGARPPRPPVYSLAGTYLVGYIRVVPTTFEVLAEPTRRRILDLLRERPWMVGELAVRLGLTQPGTSKHLRVLREAGLVRVRRDAQRRWYELCHEPLLEVDEWLRPYRALWSGRLDALERHLDESLEE
ncbi:MAG: winged helix-turn-helix transcriptional regulator [Saccharothrix sp.]|nr:winged helix-turn-helix transcriptional regulator [Saccharothrix sp.]